MPAPGPRLRAVTIALALTVLLAAALTVVLQRAPRRSGANFTLVATVSIPLAAGQQLCEPAELVPGDTAGLRVVAQPSGAGGEELQATVLDSAGTIASGRLAAGWRAGAITVPISKIRATTSGTVCLRDAGAGRVLLGGSVPDPPYTISIDGRPLSGRLRIEYMRGGSESWLDLLNVLTYRFSLGRSTLTHVWASAAVLVLMLAVIALTARVLMRPEGGRR